jgi:hypothetical protein
MHPHQQNEMRLFQIRTPQLLCVAGEPIVPTDPEKGKAA